MRIVGGRFRGHGLAGPKSNATRPTSDRLRERLFDILIHGHDDPVGDARVLDLFSGTGALGLEALSRGARSCLFVEEAAEARAVIRANVEALGLGGVTRLWRRDATRLGARAPMEPFDLAFLDPPYGRGLADAALAAMIAGDWMRPHGLVVVEEAADVEIRVPTQLEVVDSRDQSDSRLLFLRRLEDPATADL